jgi:hypothetical protein
MIYRACKWWLGIAAVVVVVVPSVASGGVTVVERDEGYQAAGEILSNPAPTGTGTTVWDSFQFNMWQVVSARPAEALSLEYGAILSVGQQWRSENGGGGGGPTCYTDQAYGTTLPPGSLTFSPDGAELDAVFHCSGWWPQTNEWVEFTLPVHLTVWTTGVPFLRANESCFDWDPGHMMCKFRLTETLAAVTGTAVYNGVNYAGAMGDAILLRRVNNIIKTP